MVCGLVEAYLLSSKSTTYIVIFITSHKNNINDRDIQS